jgi:glycosyltransferase involved in cell wall biosynthesis
MRLCVVSGTFHPEPGGPPTYLYHLLPALQARGHSVSVITYGEPEQHNPDLYPYPVKRISRRQSVPARLLAMTCEVLRQGRRADLLFVSDYGLPAALANIWLRRPMVLKIVSDFSWEFAYRRGWTTLPVDQFQMKPHSFRVGIVRAIQRFYVRSMDAVIVPSKHVEQLARGWDVPLSQVHLIYNALPKPGVRLPQKPQARRMLGWPIDEMTFITVGRLAEVKRVDLQFHALARLENGRLVVVGDGPDRAALEQLTEDLRLAERIVFTGALPHSQALLAIRAADVMLLTSHTEGLSHVLLEAMALGTPVIASDVGGNPEVLTNGEDGLLVAFGDGESLVSAMQRLANDPSQRGKLAQAAVRSAERFSWERLVEQTDALLREVAGE